MTAFRRRFLRPQFVFSEPRITGGMRLPAVGPAGPSTIRRNPRNRANWIGRMCGVPRGRPGT